MNERRPQTAAPGGRSNKPKDIEEEKKGAKPTTAPKDRPQTAKVQKPEEEKKLAPPKPTPAQPGKKPVPSAASKDEGDADDPIARSLAERTKAGSLSAVVASKTATSAPSTKPQVKPPPANEKKPAAGEAKKPEDAKKATNVNVEKPSEKKP